MLPAITQYYLHDIYLTEDAEILELPDYTPTGEYFKKGEILTPLYEGYPYRYLTNGKNEGIIDLNEASYDYAEDVNETEEDTMLISPNTENDIESDVEVEEKSMEVNEIAKTSIDNLAICSFIALVALLIILIKIKLSIKKDKNNQG